MLAAALFALLLPGSPHLLASGEADLKISGPSNEAEPVTVDCSKGGGKVHMFQCAMRSLDRLPGGRWLKWAIYVWLVAGLSYLTLRHLVGFWNWLRPGTPKRRNDDRKR